MKEFIVPERYALPYKPHGVSPDSKYSSMSLLTLAHNYLRRTGTLQFSILKVYSLTKRTVLY